MASKKRRMLNNHARALSEMPSLIKAAEKGNTEAQNTLAAFYATDDLSGLKDEAEAVKWYTKAAEHGHTMAQYSLGYMIILGEGVEKDVAKGLRWMEQSASNGEEYTAMVLAQIYKNGEFGVEPDVEKSEYWKERAGDFKDRI